MSTWYKTKHTSFCMGAIQITLYYRQVMDENRERKVVTVFGVPIYWAENITNNTHN